VSLFLILGSSNPVAVKAALAQGWEPLSLGDVPSGAAAIGVYLYLISFVGVILFYYRRWLVSIMEVSYLNSFSHAGKALSLFYAVVLLKERLPLGSLLCFALILIGTSIAAGPRRGARTGPESS
jgi:drug/metabolite transporter (DMT)-like permease